MVFYGYFRILIVNFISLRKHSLRFFIEIINPFTCCYMSLLNIRGLNFLRKKISIVYARVGVAGWAIEIVRWTSSTNNV